MTRAGSFPYGGRDHLGIGGRHHSVTRGGIIQELGGGFLRNQQTRVGKLELRVPQDRDGRFSTELFERYQRSEQALVATLAEMGACPRA
jgi:putative transposase